MGDMTKRTSSDEKASLASLSQSAAAWLVGRTPRALRDSDAPRELDGRYNGRALVEWFVSRQSESDPLLVDGDSPALERYRQARADLAEMEVAERQGVLVVAADYRPALLRIATIVRRCGERLQAKFGAEALEMLNSALNEAEQLVCAEFKE